jgi:hypothetical protein
MRVKEEKRVEGIIRNSKLNMQKKKKVRIMRAPMCAEDIVLSSLKLMLLLLSCYDPIIAVFV